jgi:aquaglyceroporin related protein
VAANSDQDGKWFPLMMLFLIFSLGTGFGWNTGYAINPARDLGPRIMATILGYGSELWSAGGYYFWVSPSRFGHGKTPT